MSEAPPEGPVDPRTRRVAARLRRGDEVIDRRELLAIEEPLEIRVRLAGEAEERRLAMTMRTPGDDRELAAGFLFTEGVVSRREQIGAVVVGSDHVRVELAAGVVLPAAGPTRSFMMTSACGVCGRSSTEGLRAQPPGPLAAGRPTLAAAIVAQTGEEALGATPMSEAVHTAPPHAQRPATVVDLCCGSGTLLSEAGLSMLRMAPGLSRNFGFMRWRDFDGVLWRRLQAEARSQIRPAKDVFLFGSDIDPRALRTASQNLQAAGLGRLSRLARCDLRDAEPPSQQPGIVLCNPPYGERMGDERELIELYRALGDTLKRRFVGYRAYVYTANLHLARQIGLRPSARHVLWNGMLEGRLLRFDLY